VSIAPAPQPPGTKIDFTRLWSVVAIFLSIVAIGLSVCNFAGCSLPVFPTPTPAPSPTPPAPTPPGPTPPTPTPAAPITLAPTYAGDVGRLIDITAETKGAKVHWRVDPGLELRVTGPLSAVVTAPAAGKYHVTAYTTIGGEATDPAESVVTIGQPTPPEPPTPPAPADPLVAAVQAAYQSELAATRATDKAALAAIYKGAASGMGTVKTAGDLFDLLKSVTQSQIADRMRATRSVIGTELGKILPSDPTAALTQQQKDAAAALMNRFVAALESI